MIVDADLVTQYLAKDQQQNRNNFNQNFRMHVSDSDSAVQSSGKKRAKGKKCCYLIWLFYYILFIYLVNVGYQNNSTN